MLSDSPEDFRRQERPARTSRLLRDFIQTLNADRVSLAEIVASLGDRGLGVLIALFAIPNIFPSTVPFGNVATGVPVVFLAVHLMMGWPRLVLPPFLARRTVGAKLLKSFAPRVAGLLSRIEPLLQPRLPGVSGAAAERWIGVLCLFLSVISSLPIPFAHILPALGLMIIGLGLIEHDGIAILLGAVTGIAGVILLGLVLLGLASGFAYLSF